MTVFACKITDADMVRGSAPEQPETVEIGQEWMDVVSGSILPVKALRNGYLDLGGTSYTRVLTEETLRAEFVCIDAPDNMTEMARA